MRRVAALAAGLAVWTACPAAAAPDGACPLDGLARLGTTRRALTDVAAGVFAAPAPDDRCAALALGALDLADREGAGACDAAARLSSEDLEGDPDALALRAALEWRCGRPRLAHDLARAALRAAPDRVLAWRVLGQVLEARLRYGAARAAYERALELDPDESGALYGLSRVVSERPARRELLLRYVAAGPPRGEAEENVRAAGDALAFLDALGDRRTWVLEKADLPGTLALRPLSTRPGQVSGWVAELELGTEERVRTLIDSGASGLHLDPRLARKAGLAALAGGTLVGGGGRREHAVDRGTLDRVAIGPLAFRSAIGVVAADSLHSTGAYRAILGLDVFGGYVVRFLPRAERLEIEQAPAPFEDDDVEVADPLQTDPWPADPSLMPVFLVEGQLLVPVRFGTRDRREETLAVLDTGAAGTVLDVAVADRLGEYQQGGLGSARLYGGRAALAGLFPQVRVGVGALDETLRGVAVLDFSLHARVLGVHVGAFVGEDVWIDNGFELDLAAATLRPLPR